MQLRLSDRRIRSTSTANVVANLRLHGSRPKRISGKESAARNQRQGISGKESAAKFAEWKFRGNCESQIRLFRNCGETARRSCDALVAGSASDASSQGSGKKTNLLSYRTHLPPTRASISSQRLSLAEVRTNRKETRISLSGARRVVLVMRRSVPSARSSLPEVRRSLPFLGRSLPEARRSLPFLGRSLPEARRSLPFDEETFLLSRINLPNYITISTLAKIHQKPPSLNAQPSTLN